MRTLYIECNMGAAGDMLTAALSELLPDPEAFFRTMNAAGIPGMRMERGEKTSCGVRGTHVSVRIGGAEEISDDVRPGELEHAHEHAHAHGHEHGHDHPHAGMAEVRAMVAGLRLPEKVKADALGVYALIAEAEAHAHGCEVEHIHFHELGMLDAVADVCAVCLLMDQIAPERVVVSPLCTGFGEVRCMHGIVPVPAPATAWLLRGVPAYAGEIRGELLTPTGAALLRYFADEFGRMPEMRAETVGCGMGMKDFPAANCVRAFLGESGGGDEIVELSCNLDDMTGEALGFAAEELLSGGALDVYMTAIQMKKGRPGVKLSCICAPADRERMAELMLRHTTTLGVRMQRMSRRVLAREEARVDTPYGELRVKRAGGRCKPEYEDVARLARERGARFLEVQRAAERDAED